MLRRHDKSSKKGSAETSRRNPIAVKKSLPDPKKPPEKIPENPAGSPHHRHMAEEISSSTAEARGYVRPERLSRTWRGGQQKHREAQPSPIRKCALALPYLIALLDLKAPSYGDPCLS